jgi:hypothetical protein
MTKKDLQEYVRKLEDAFIDALQHQDRWYIIKEHTGLSEERCKEIIELYDHVVDRYHRRRFSS